MVVGMEDKDAAMVAFIGVVGVGRKAKGMSASDFKVLTQGVALLFVVEVGFHHDVDVVVPTPEPVEGVFAKRGDVGYMDPHGVLGVSWEACREAVDRSPGSQGAGSARWICLGVTNAVVWTAQICTI